jgi:hypothetical protein
MQNLGEQAFTDCIFAMHRNSCLSPIYVAKNLMTAAGTHKLKPMPSQYPN